MHPSSSTSPQTEQPLPPSKSVWSPDTSTCSQLSRDPGPYPPENSDFPSSAQSSTQRHPALTTPSHSSEYWHPRWATAYPQLKSPVSTGNLAAAQMSSHTWAVCKGWTQRGPATNWCLAARSVSLRRSCWAWKRAYCCLHHRVAGTRSPSSLTCTCTPSSVSLSLIVT